MKVFWTSVVFLISLIVFMILEFGQITYSFNRLVQPILFSSVTAMIFFNGKFKQAVLWFSIILLTLMIVFYLSNLLIFANWVGSLGMGIFVILTISFFPKLIKDGHI